MQVFNFDSRDLMAQIEGISFDDATSRLEQMLEDKYGDTSGHDRDAAERVAREISAAIMSHPTSVNIW